MDPRGDVYFTDVRGSRIHKVDHATGAATVFKEDAGRVSGLMFGPDGRLYAAQGGRKRIVAYTPDGSETLIAEGAAPNDLAVSARGEVYFTDPGGKRIWLVDAQGVKRVVHEGLEFPNGIVLSPDQRLLAVADSRSRWVWSFQWAPTGRSSTASRSIGWRPRTMLPLSALTA